MAASFFFYDLETSGFGPRDARIMQFAGQRTDMDLNPVGEPISELIRLSPDVLPDPGAILVTGITPQMTLADGLTEAEFLKLFHDEVVKPDTIFLGFNSVRFDDEFMRFLLYRNFYDAYEWQWKDGCSRWDLLDIVRITRALKPEGIKWPFAPDGKPTNRLEMLTQVNGISHENAHDALADVQATIEVARLIKTAQPELFNYLVNHRGKKEVQEIVESGKPFMYASGRYPSQYMHATAAVLLGRHSERGEALVYDLRQDPTPFLDMSADELAEAWKFTRDPDAVRLPVKTIKYNHCPVIVPGVVQDAETLERLSLSLEDIKQHMTILSKHAEQFAAKLFELKDKMDSERNQQQASLVDDQLTVDGRLYDGFVGGGDKAAMQAVRSATPDEIMKAGSNLQDGRLRSLLPLYKARNYPTKLSVEERVEWEQFVHQRLFDGGEKSAAARYFARLQELTDGDLTAEQKYLLEELKLYGESIVPADAIG